MWYLGNNQILPLRRAQEATLLFVFLMMVIIYKLQKPGRHSRCLDFQDALIPIFISLAIGNVTNSYPRNRESSVLHIKRR